MVSVNDILLFAVALLLSVGVAGIATGMDLPGSGGGGNLVCSIPGSSLVAPNCGTEVAETYDLTTSIQIQATDVNVVFGEFSYETTKSSNYGFSFLGPEGSLAFGAENVEIGYQLVDENGTVRADGSKYIGSIEALESETVTFGSDNLEQGTYTVRYEASYNRDFGFFTGGEQINTFEEQIRVPRVIE